MSRRVGQKASLIHYCSLSILSFSLASCSCSPSVKDAPHTLVYTAGPLGEVRDDRCIVLYLYSSGNLIWGDILESHEEVVCHLRAAPDLYKYTAAKEFLVNPNSTLFFYSTEEYVDSYKILLLSDKTN